jgi:hypothetical protein
MPFPRLPLYKASSASRCGTVARARPYRGKLAAGLGTLIVDGAEAVHRSQIHAVVIGFLRQHKQFRALSVRDNDAVFDQAFRELFQRAHGLVFRGHAQANQVRKLHLDRHRATAGFAAIAHSRLVLFPS